MGTSVSFYCFYLSSYLRRFFYFLSLNPKQKKKQKILHYYSLLFPEKKHVTKKIQDGKKSPEMPSDCRCISSDTWWIQSVGEALW